MQSFITGVAGTILSPDERTFLRDADPFGFILFGRNIETPDQVRALVADLRAAVGWQAPVLIDQEGGRVQRLGPPHWPAYPAGETYGRLFARAAEDGLQFARLGARLIAADLMALGIDVDCLPLADVPVAEADPVIGNRAYGRDPGQVAAIARAVTDGLLEGGVLPVLKHIPGHGRANADSHLALPVVDVSRPDLEATDFVPFRALADLPLGMTAHVVYTALDPDRPATTSPVVIGQVIRGDLGFSGLLMGDDVSMNALSGTIAERSRASLDAGCDVVLHCNGKMEEMKEVAAQSSRLSGAALSRAEGALARRTSPTDFDAREARARFSSMIAAAA
jgi:beta-N-acetylhexosaminidase